MEFAELVIVFAVTITLSNIASRILPMIPAPLIQIFLGVVLGLTEWGQSIDFEPELFLVMIIAPLLFREEKKQIFLRFSKFRDNFVLGIWRSHFDPCRGRCDVIIPVAKCPTCCLLWSSVGSDRCGSSQFSFWTSEYP